MIRMESEGLVIRLRRKYFSVPESKLVRGILQPTVRGYGFVIPEERHVEDIFIPARAAAGAVRGDRVEVFVKPAGKKGKTEGRVLRILEQGRPDVLGVFQQKEGTGFLIPLDSAGQEIPLPERVASRLEPGMIVSLNRGDLEIKEVLGHPEEEGVDTAVIIRKYRLSKEFQAEALLEAEGIDDSIESSDLDGRLDLRKWTTVTIDGPDARDFDDAVGIRELPGGLLQVGVHIADVSHYVRPQTFLDRDAMTRGTSVYFSDRTLPMLPEKLSERVCSLRPGEDKLAISVFLEVDGGGSVVKAEFHPSLIRTRRRMTYDTVSRILAGEPEQQGEHADVVSVLVLMERAAGLLRDKRLGEGSLDIDIVEPQLVSRNDSLQDVVPQVRTRAHHIIEEFMIAANEAVALFLQKKGGGLIYRIHPVPVEEDLAELRRDLSPFGFSLPPPSDIRPLDMQRILEQVRGKLIEKFVSLRLLRSLRLALYSEENEGHFGLAKKVYTHFTSPIRRYPDLVVHRMLKNALKGERIVEPGLAAVSAQASAMERAADDAERDLLEWRILRILKRRIGETFEGIIVAWA